jgi:Fungal specific transcription factor domain
MTVVVGPCELTTDPLRHLMIESTPPVRFDIIEEPTLDEEGIKALANQFFLVVSGILDLFDPAWLMDKLSIWINNPLRREDPDSPVIYLALAIGAQGRARDESDDDIAEKCFDYGRHLALHTLMDDTCLLTVQAFTLITYYMLTGCRRNGAFTNLGVAVRAAYALGIHRHETNIAFTPEEGISRERAWKTLRVCDLFLSASMGRPPATSETDCNIPWALVESAADRETSTVPSQVSSAIFRICHIFERILVEVYSKRAVSLDLAASISKQHREWTQELPRMLKIDGLDVPDAMRSSGVSRQLGSGIVTMAYYYSIILLTRPFLTYKVCHSPKTGTQSESSSSSRADLIIYADACIDSAVKGIDTAYDLVFKENMPRRQPLVINSVFTSALCVGLAFLDEYDRRGWPLGRSLERGIAILRHFGKLNPQSARYADICQRLQAATAICVDNRDNTLLRSRSQQVRSIFGDVSDFEGSQPKVQSEGQRSRIQPQSDEYLYPNLPQYSVGCEPISPPSMDGGTIQQESIITTSGLMTRRLVSGQAYQSQDDSDFSGLPFDFNTISSDPASNDYSWEEDTPLFSLINDVTRGSYSWQ